MRTLLVAGLGNPEPSYAQTRHNVGFLFVDDLGRAWPCNAQKRDAVVGICAPQRGLKVLLAKPEAFVNESGAAILRLKRAHKIRNENIVIVHDDLDIEFGKVKISFDSGAGGHRGVESVIASLKTKKFFRIRIGTATLGIRKARTKPEKTKNVFVKHFVLSPFSPGERRKLPALFQQAREMLLSRLIQSS